MTVRDNTSSKFMRGETDKLTPAPVLKAFTDSGCPISPLPYIPTDALPDFDKRLKATYRWVFAEGGGDPEDFRLSHEFRQYRMAYRDAANCESAR
mgnify:CR=1 FL=1